MLDQGVPYDVVWSMNTSELMAYSISIQELKTRDRFDWDRMIWIEATLP